MKKLPHVTFVGGADEDEGYRLGTALEDLVFWALENGYSADDLHERIDEAVENASDEQTWRQGADGPNEGRKLS